MNFLLPEKLLDTQTCSLCKKYLSHPPVRVYRDVGPRCGRCSVKNDGGTASFIERILQNAIFPCVNRYQGCRRLLKFQDVPEHEKTCIGDEYQCPLCPDDQYVPNSMLYLVNHYKLFHKKYYLTEPFFHIDPSLSADHSYLYCNNYENILVVIRTVSTGSRISINVSTAATYRGEIKYKVNFFANGYQSEERECEAGLNGLHFEVTEIDPLQISQASSTVLCVLELNTDALNDAMLTNKIDYRVQSTSKTVCEKSKENLDSNKIRKEECNKVLPEDYGQVPVTQPSFVKLMSDIYLTDDFKSTFGIVSSRKINEIRGNVTILTNIEDKYINTMCRFCENYYSTSGAYLEIYICSHTVVCGTCFNVNNGDVCRYCKKLYQSPTPMHYKLFYYCRFGCNQFFSGGPLSIHERYCTSNLQSPLNDTKFAKQYFGEYFQNSSPDNKTMIVRSNRVVFDRNTFGYKGKIYMIVDYNFSFHCIVMYETNYETRRTRFWVLHEYFREKCYILFKIIGNDTYVEQPNSFYIKANDDRVFFVAVIRKVE